MLDWVDLRDIPFREPFLLQTIDRAIKGESPRTVCATPIAALHALDSLVPGRDPDGLVFHMSRCGSTLVSRSVGILPGTVVAAEPDALNDLLELDIRPEDEPALVELIRLMVRALGRARPEGGRHYVLKLSSFAICRAQLLRLAFPAAPFVFISRTPLEVLGSILASPPGWVQLIRHPREARLLLRIPEDEVSMEAPEDFLARGLAGFLQSALELADERLLLVDYEELPDAIAERILPHFAIAISDIDRARMAREARYDAKATAAERPVFVADSERKRAAVPAEIASLSAKLVEPLHRQLEQRRIGQLASSN